MSNILQTFPEQKHDFSYVFHMIFSVNSDNSGELVSSSHLATAQSRRDVDRDKLTATPARVV